MSRRECPSCGSDNIRPAQFRLLDCAGFVLFLHAFRCRECKHRFWRLRRKALRTFAIFGGFGLAGMIFIYFLLLSLR